MAKDKKKRNRTPIYKNKRTLTVYLVLRGLVIFAMIRAIFRAEYESVLLCALTLVLMIMPSVLSRRLAVELPGTLEIIILLFIFSAEILGEMNNFYVLVPYWDILLHTLNGFLCAAIGFALVDLLNRDEHFSFQLSPAYLGVVAFCFSMTIGVLWEFFEFAADSLVGVDMQKDTILSAIHSVSLDPTNTNTVVHIRDIADVIIVHSDGSQEALGLGGYLDVGICDTMNDLLVNFIGAVVFSVIGYFYAKHRDRKSVATQFIPKVLPQSEAEDSPPEQIEEK